MLNQKNYTLEYLIDPGYFSEEQKLKDYVYKKLGKNYSESTVSLKVKKSKLMFTLSITSIDRVINICYEKLDFDRKDSFIIKDELGESLRLKAYPILASIELNLRRFIYKAMIDLFGFDWWETSFFDQKIRKKVANEASKQKKKSQNNSCHKHQLEFTYFDDLADIVTAKFSIWPLDKSFTVNDLSELFSNCSSIQEIKQQIEDKTKIIDLWNDVFSIYFEDDKDWHKLEEDINQITDIRNKVMHHNLIRLHELKKLEDVGDKVEEVIKRAKTTLTDLELEDIKKILEPDPESKLMLKRINFLFNNKNNYKEIDFEDLSENLQFMTTREAVELCDKLKIPTNNSELDN